MIDFPRLDVIFLRAIHRHRWIQFTVESALVLGLLAAIRRLIMLIDETRLPRWLLLPDSLLTISSVLLLFFAIVFYGTSFEVPPLRLATLLLPLLPNIKKRNRALREASTLALGASRHVSGGMDDAIEAIPHNTVTVPTSLARYDLVERMPAHLGDAAQNRREAEHILEASSKSAEKLALKMERRINTYLILGVFVGLIGLIVWYYSFSLMSFDKDHIISNMIPRVTILFFIELLAGFFLRQYRIGVEDLKYFLDLARQADSRRVAYSIAFGPLNDATAKRKFLTSLMEEHSHTSLKKGETTTALEAMKAEENIALKAMGVLGDQLESITKILHKQK